MWKSMAAAALLAGTATAQAYVPPQPACNTLSAGGVTINECVNPMEGFSWYDVTNGTDQSIVAFAVSTQAPPFLEVSALRPDWTGTYVSKSTWDQRFDGTFEQFFGTTDTGAFMYSSGGLGKPIAPGEATDVQFLFFAPLDSHFVAFGSSGPIAGSLLSVSSVPEPEAYALALCGLAVLGAMTRRRARSEAATAA